MYVVSCICNLLFVCFKILILSLQKPNNLSEPVEIGPSAFKALLSKIVSEYDQEIPQSQTADNPVAPRGRAAQPSGDTRKTN